MICKLSKDEAELLKLVSQKCEVKLDEPLCQQLRGISRKYPCLGTETHPLRNSVENILLKIDKRITLGNILYHIKLNEWIELSNMVHKLQDLEDIARKEANELYTKHGGS